MERENWVVKANKLIEAKGRLGMVEQKLFASLISEIRQEDKDFQLYKLEIKDIAEFINLNSNAIYEQIKSASRNLRNKEIVIENIDEKGKKSFIVTSLLSSARYKEGEGHLEVYIDPNLKPYLLAINGTETPFTKYMIKNILKLNSSYSIRVYELLKQCEKMKKREFDIENFRELLGITDEYNRFFDFEKRVLKVAETEINEKTDILIKYKKIKSGRKISKIAFTIEPKFVDEEKENIRLFKENGIFDFEEVRRNCGLINAKFNDKQILELYEIANKNVEGTEISPYDYVKFYYENMMEKDNIKDKFAYLKKSLEMDWNSFKNQITITEIIKQIG